MIAGATGGEVCSLCNTRVTGLEMVSSGGGLAGISPDASYVGDSGCAPKLTPHSYNKQSPFTPAWGLVSSTFALKWVWGTVQSRPQCVFHTVHTCYARTCPTFSRSGSLRGLTSTLGTA